MSGNQEASARVGQILREKWILERLVGAGGMASVYAARHRVTESRVAVKILHRELSDREDIRERFRVEGRTANRVEHPGVVKVPTATLPKTALRFW